MKFLKIVLVSSKYPRNIGLISRIMSNFAVDQLILVSPQCDLDLEARQGAAQGQNALENATIYDSWNEFYEKEPEGLRIGFSRRQGRRRASVDLPTFLNDKIIRTDRPTYLIFGAEDHGLSAEDLEMVHRMVHFDLPGELQSMNLSHSVLVAVLGFYQKFGQTGEATENQDTIKDPEPFLKLWLEKLNFDLESQDKWNALTMLKQLIMKASPTNEELHKLEMIVRQTIRKLKD